MSARVDLQHLAARAEIEDLVVRYCLAMDDADRGRLLPLFADDATHVVAAGTVRGCSEIVEYLLERRGRKGSTVHVPAAHLVEIAGPTTATGTVLAHLVLDGDGQTQVGMARYHDRYVHTDGAWRFAHRQLEIVHLRSWPSTGPVPATHPAR